MARGMKNFITDVFIRAGIKEDICSEMENMSGLMGKFTKGNG